MPILYVGGNDPSGGKTTNTFEREIRDITGYILLEKCKPQSGLICPKSKVDVISFNKIINQIAD